MKKYFFAIAVMAAICSFVLSDSKKMTLTGVVTDSSTGAFLPGASVGIKGERANSFTLKDGSFRIQINKRSGVLVCVAKGYDSQEIRFSENVTSLVVRLKPDAQNISLDKKLKAAEPMQEVVVTGYYNQLQGRTTGLAIVSAPKSSGKNEDKDYFNTEDYDGITENRFKETGSNPLSTFSIDVDGASYSNVRRFLQSGSLPPAGAVRVEELINYFHYDYPQPSNDQPFYIQTELSACPWNPQHQLVMIGLQGKKILTEDLPSSNLVFLIDVSGSMSDENKLPLVKASMNLLVDQLREQDRVSVVVYAGNSGLALPSTSGAEKHTIKAAIDNLESGGSTAGGAGIQLAYKVARENFIKGANNRVILCTDGDFNVGPGSDAELETIIEQERKSGVFLTVLGYGMGNYKDNKMQKLADKGNGNHSYIDNLNEAKKVLVTEFGGTLFTIAKDVKLQVEFNPEKIRAYRLVGYENRLLNKEDFNNDIKDAGDLGSGHTVTALYELIPVGVDDKFIETTDPLKYQQPAVAMNAYHGKEIMNIKFRYKEPDGMTSKLIQHPVNDVAAKGHEVSDNFSFVSAVAQFGMLLSNSAFRQQSSFENVIASAKRSIGKDKEGYRKEFITLVKKAKELFPGEALSVVNE